MPASAPASDSNATRFPSPITQGQVHYIYVHLAYTIAY